MGCRRFTYRFVSHSRLTIKETYGCQTKGGHTFFYTHIAIKCLKLKTILGFRRFMVIFMPISQIANKS